MPPSSSKSTSFGFLQGLQAAFDRSRGFDFPEAALADELLNRDHDARLRSIEFATMGLAGEIGEVANQVKKARREFWTGGDPERNIDAAATELADIYAYLLKLASTLDVNLDVLYLIRLCENYLRFPPGLSASRRAGSYRFAGRRASERLRPPASWVDHMRFTPKRRA